jgi:hypothetical protein
MLGVGRASQDCLRRYEQEAHMRSFSDRAIVMRPLLAPLAAASLLAQLGVSGCAVGPSYRKPATTLEKFHSAAALEARQTSAPAPSLETWWDGFNDPMLARIVQQARARSARSPVTCREECPPISACCERLYRIGYAEGATALIGLR